MAEWSTAIIACLPCEAAGVFGGFTPGFQPRIVPSSAANRKTAGKLTAAPLLFTPAILNAPWACAVLKTSPVGAPPVPSGSSGDRIATTSACGVPAVLYSDDFPAPLSDTQKEEVADSPTPHGLTRFGSKNFATCTMPFLSVSVGTLLTC